MNGATLDGRWSSRRAPFVAATLVTAQLVVLPPHAITHSHTHTTQRTAPLSHSPLHAHKDTQARSLTRAAAGGQAALVQRLAGQLHAARACTSWLIDLWPAQLTRGGMTLARTTRIGTVG